MSTYLKIVFGIKQRYRIDDVKNVLRQQRSCSILISLHNALDVDEFCDRQDVHYHGVVELIRGEHMIENFLTRLSPYCQYIKDSFCKSPVEYLAYITSPPKRIIFDYIVSNTLSEILQSARSNQLEILKRKKEKRFALVERNQHVRSLVDFVLKFGCNSTNISSHLKKSEQWASFQRKDYEPIIDAALNVSRKIILNDSILDLSSRLEVSDDYLNPEESARYVKEWCLFQNINVTEFTKKLIQCLDRKSRKRNTIYLQGSGNSKKSYIVQSIREACIHVGQVKTESSAYPYVWQQCINKRLIVIHEPHFSTVNFDQLDKVLSGSETLIYKHNDVLDYLLPTPVIILANDPEWTSNLELSQKIKKRFICCYEDLKNYPISTGKKLHPRWLNVLNDFCNAKKPTTNNPVEMVNGERRSNGTKSTIKMQTAMEINYDAVNTIEAGLNCSKRRE